MPSQAPFTDQMLALLRLANREGLYDAADWVESRFRWEQREDEAFSVGIPAELSRVQAANDEARKYVADVGNWSAIDGRPRLILALLDGTVKAPQRGEGWAAAAEYEFPRAGLTPDKEPQQ